MSILKNDNSVRYFLIILLSSTFTYCQNNDLLKTRSYHLPLRNISLSSNDPYTKGEALYLWTQIIGPHRLRLQNRRHKTAIITDIKMGFYVFQVHILLKNKNQKISKIVQIEIFDKINQKPKADAGNDITVILPIKTLRLSGSNSSDDIGLVRYKWRAGKNNPAGVEVLGNSDREPNLLLKNLYPGKYEFKLTVADATGLRDKDKMVLTVLKGEHMKEVVQIYFIANLRSFTYLNLKHFKSQVYLILSKAITKKKLAINILRLKQDSFNGFAVLEFYVTEESKTEWLPASTLIKILRPVILDINIFMHPVVQINSPECPRACFIHGYCDYENNKCVCDMFWINNLWTGWVDEHSSKDCEWNIFYTSVVGLLIVFVAFVSCRQLYQSLWLLPSCGLSPPTKDA